jgi:hypothetical protein
MNIHGIATLPRRDTHSFGQELLTNKTHENTLHLLNAHVHMLDHTPVQHPRRNIPPTAFLLEVIKTLEDDAFAVGETVSNIR